MEMEKLTDIQQAAKLTDMLEAAIDANSVKTVLTHLSIICSEKADHIRANYSDKSLERAWRKASNHLDECANRLPHDAGIGYGS